MLLPKVAPADDALPHWPPVLALEGPGATSDTHAHHAIHAVFAREGTLRLRCGEAVYEGPAVVTAPDTPHALDAAGRDVVLVFLDPESDGGRRLAAQLAEPVAVLDGAVRDAVVAAWSPAAWMGPEGRARVDALITALGGDGAGPPRAMHPRVRRVLAHLRTAEAEDDTSLDALSAVAGLSPGRLMHAFTDSVGIPLRPYLAWLKLQRAATAIARGAALGEAAHAAGFSDAAHLSRTFRRMFGMAPSAIVAS